MTGLGHNMPPAKEAIGLALEDLRTEAGNFLDGAAVENQGQADAVGLIISTAKKLKKDGDAARKEEKQPHLEAGKRVDDDWRPIIAQCDTIIKAAQAPLTTFLNAERAKQEAEAQKAREEADRLAQEAIEAERSSSGNVEAIESAAALAKQADKAEREAKRQAKAKPQVSGADRAIGLRTYKKVTVENRKAALLWIAKRDPDALEAFVTSYAEKHAPTRPMDGVSVTEEKRVA